MSKIMIVEDNDVMRYFMRTVLEYSGHEVVAEVEDANSALKYARESKPDVVLIDMVLPGEMTGVEIMQKLKSISPTKIIITTALDEQKIDNATLLGKGCDAILRKPFSREELEDVLNKVLNGDGSGTPQKPAS